MRRRWRRRRMWKKRMRRRSPRSGAIMFVSCFPVICFFVCPIFTPQRSPFSSASALYDIYQYVCSEFLTIFDSTVESDVEQAPKASSRYLLLLSLLFILYLMFIWYWPAQPDNPLTIRVASVIAFSVCLFSVGSLWVICSLSVCYFFSYPTTV